MTIRGNFQFTVDGANKVNSESAGTVIGPCNSWKEWKDSERPGCFPKPKAWSFVVVAHSLPPIPSLPLFGKLKE